MSLVIDCTLFSYFVFLPLVVPLIVCSMVSLALRKTDEGK